MKNIKKAVFKIKFNENLKAPNCKWTKNSVNENLYFLKIKKSNEILHKYFHGTLINGDLIKDGVILFTNFRLMFIKGGVIYLEICRKNLGYFKILDIKEPLLRVNSFHFITFKYGNNVFLEIKCPNLNGIEDILEEFYEKGYE